MVTLEKNENEQKLTDSFNAGSFSSCTMLVLMSQLSWWGNFPPLKAVRWHQGTSESRLIDPF